MKRLNVAALGFCAFLLAGNAHAIDFRFATTPMASLHDCPLEAPGCSEAGGDVFGDADLVYQKGGLTLTVIADEGSLVMADLAPANGGLGALFLDTTTEGVPLDTLPENDLTNPDNVVFNQSLIFDFDKEVKIYTLMNYNNSHGNAFSDGADFTLLIDGGGEGKEFDVAAGHMVDLVGLGIDATGSRFEFRAIEGGEGFYISAFNVGAAIPEPGTAMLLGLGLAGLGAMRPKRTA